ncbi:hypothetical protein WEU32_11790 [Brevundimonas sp. BH3]
MASQFVGIIAQIAMGPINVFIGILVLTWIFPRLMTSGSKLSRTTTKPAPNFIAKSRLQTVANGDYGPLDPEYQPLRLDLPKIETARPWVQRLIAAFGKPLPLLPIPPQMNRVLSEAHWLSLPALIGIYVFSLNMNPQWHAQNLWLLPSLAPIVIILAYRSTFRRLYDIYTADAVSTGRYAFPALRR